LVDEPVSEKYDQLEKLMTTQSQNNSGRTMRLLSSLAIMTLIFAVACGKKDASSQPTASAPPAAATKDLSDYEAKQKVLATSGLDDKSIERRKSECEPLKPLLDQCAYLEAGFAQGINLNDFIQTRRRVNDAHVIVPLLLAEFDKHKIDYKYQLWIWDKGAESKVGGNQSAAPRCEGIAYINTGRPLSPK